MAQLADTSLFNDANLVAYYKLEDVNDSKASFHLTNNGTTPFNSGKYGNGANGGTSNTTKYLSISNNLGIDGGNCSISAWININEAIGAGSGGGNGEFTFVKQQSAGTDTAYFLTYEYNSGTPRLAFRRFRQGIAGDQATYTITLTVGLWYHLVLTYDTTNMRGYVNNVLQAGPTAMSGVGTGATDQFSILADANSPSGQAGAIVDDVAVFNKVLTVAEIDTLYNETISGGFYYMSV